MWFYDLLMVYSMFASRYFSRGDVVRMVDPRGSWGSLHRPGRSCPTRRFPLPPLGEPSTGVPLWCSAAAARRGQCHSYSVDGRQELGSLPSFSEVMVGWRC